MEDQMNQPGTMSPAPQKPKRPAKSQRKGGRLYTIEEANTFAASMCAMSDETKLSDALEIADSTGNAFVYNRVQIKRRLFERYIDSTDAI